MWTPTALLPAAWLLAVGWAVLAALGRWFDPVPRRVGTVFALVLCLLFAPVLLGGKVLLPLGNLAALVPYRTLPPPEKPTHALQADLVHQITPWQSQVRGALLGGRWPLWNEQAGAGMPLMANPQSQSFQPLAFASYVLPLAAGVGVTAALRVLVALVGMFLLLRRQGLGEPAALVGSLGYGLGGGLLLWFGWPIANSVAWTPMVLYAVVRCRRVGGRRDVALLAVTTTALLLGGHPETVIQSGAVVGLMVAGCAWERRRAGGPVGAFLARCAVAAALAGLFVAPSLLLQQAYLPKTDRAVALSWSVMLPTLEQLRAAFHLRDLTEWGRRVEIQTLETVAAHAFGDHEAFWGSINAVESGSACVGAAIAALALTAVARRGRHLPQEGLMMGLAAVCALLVAQPPYANRFIGQLPLLAPSAVHHNHRLVLVVGLAAAYVAACEVERWRRGERHPLAAAIGAVVVSALVGWAYLGHPQPWSGELGSDGRRWFTHQLAAVALVPACLWLCGGRTPKWAVLRRAAPWALVAVVGAELLLLHRGGLTPGPARLFYPLTPAIAFLRDHLGEARLVGVANAFPPNFSQLYGLTDTRIDDPSRPSSYMVLVAPLRPSPLTLDNNNFLEQPGARLYDLLGVRYVIAAPRERLPLPIARRDKTAWIYEHPRPLPRLFLPAAASVYQGESWMEWIARPRDFAARALVSKGPPGSHTPRWRARRGRAVSLHWVHPEPTRWSARFAAPERRLLATSIYQDGGWRLLVRGRPYPTLLANGPLLGAWVPRGVHPLELLYRPPRFTAGALLAALALLAGIVWLLPPPGGRRQVATNGSAGART